jgi:hypothetical protein
MEAVYFTATAIVLYVASDALLDQVERRLGRRLQYRSVVFFGILATLAVVSFTILERFGPG